MDEYAALNGALLLNEKIHGIVSFETVEAYTSTPPASNPYTTSSTYTSTSTYFGTPYALTVLIVLKHPTLLLCIILKQERGRQICV